MILKQIHKLPTEPNWSNIGIAIAVTIGLIALIKFGTNPAPTFTDTNNKK